MTGELDIVEWEKELKKRTNFTRNDIEKIKKHLPKIIFLTNEADIKTLKWLCHGHIGSSVLWAAFARCIYDVTKIIDGKDDAKRKKASAFLRYKNDDLGKKLCGRYWAKTAFSGKAEYPSAVFELLGLNKL